MQSVWRRRKGGRANPILIVDLYGDRAAFCGPSGDPPNAAFDLEIGQVQRICSTALEKPNRHSAHAFLQQMIEQVGDELVGIRNQGLLSTHELRMGVPRRDDWDEATRRSVKILDRNGPALLEGLGYSIAQLQGPVSVLKDVDRETAIAVFLNEGESFDLPQKRFSDKTPIAYALGRAEAMRLDFVIGNAGKSLRLYMTDPEPALSSRGRSDTYVEANAGLLTEKTAGHLWLLFSAQALRKGGSLHDILARSRDFATSLSIRLRDRIYNDVVPGLAKAIADARDLADPARKDLDETYQMAMILLYRILFIADIEDEGFLPRYNPRYEARSLKRKAHDLQSLIAAGEPFDETSTSHWDDVAALIRAVNKGNREWGVPEYDGNLLSSDAAVSPIGGKLASLSLTNDRLGPLLASLLLDETEEGHRGPVDFRDLGVRELGVIYEGLLESELSVAGQMLTLKDGFYVPTDDPAQATVQAGEVYLHGASGERKSTGTYYTKDIFVEHLLEHSLEPALDDHITHLEGLSDREAEEAFFDFKVADIAMGSGHFLVGAVDRIESRFSTYLAGRSLPRIEEELDRLERAASALLGGVEDAPKMERSQLLRRQIARRCIYGIDLNPLATELAKLSLWIHTFVPGLPLTFLDYNLVTGDSLSGIGTLGEVADIVGGDRKRLDWYLGAERGVVDRIRGQIVSLGRTAEANASEIRSARETRADLERQLAVVRAAFDILAASRISSSIDPRKALALRGEGPPGTEEYRASRQALSHTQPLHFPAAFPEVFGCATPGFDVIVGNPPWEEATLEEDRFWIRYEPRLQGRPQAEQEKIKERLRKEHPDLLQRYRDEVERQSRIRETLRRGPYQGMGRGDPDTYKAFCWRFWNLVREGGYVGVVLPRSAFAAAGSEPFRRTLMSRSRIWDLTFLVNNRNWVFPAVHPQYTISLIAFQKAKVDSSSDLPLRGPYPDLASYTKGLTERPHRFQVAEALTWTGTAALPLLPEDPRSVGVFKKISQKPELGLDKKGDWRARPQRELDATNDRKKKDGTVLMHFVPQGEEPPRGYWPIFKGASFNPPDKETWITDTGEYYAWADPRIVTDLLLEKRRRGFKLKRSVFSEMPAQWIRNKKTLPCLHPRVAFRDLTNRTNTRTVVASLIPPRVFLTNTAPYFLWPRGDEKDQAYLLGVLNSIPLDWYARRFVEIHLNFHILNALPIPRPGRESSLWQRVVQIGGRLAASGDRFEEWARAVGVGCGPMTDAEQLELIYELDAVVSHLYGLSREDVEVVFSTFHRGWDCRPRLEQVLSFYEKWEGE